MGIYQRKPFKAQQINSLTDCPSFAYGMMQEAFGDYDFCLVNNGKTNYGNFGDYICQRPDGSAVYVCKQEVFEACNESVDEQTRLIVEAGRDSEGLDIFVAAMSLRLREKRAEGRGGWWNESQCSTMHLRDLFMKAVERGNMVDIANYAMMIYCRENF